MTRIPCEPGDSIPQALDAALGRSLAAPALPAGFRSQLHALVQRTQQEAMAQRERLEAERRVRLSEIEADYRQARLRAALDVTGITIVTAILVAVLWPMVLSAFGPEVLRDLPLYATLAALAAGALLKLQRMGFENPLEQI